MKGKQSPELDFILSVCIREEGNAHPGGLDWNEIYRIAEGNRISPLFLQKLNGNISMNPVLQQMESRSKTNSLSTMWVAGEILRVVKISRDHQIPIHVYKGPVWSQWLYGDFKIRSSGDLDLFVSEVNLFPLIKLMLDTGYTILPFHRSLLDAPDDVRKAFLDSDYHIPLQRTDATGHLQGVIELHWRIAYPRLCFTIFPEEFETYSTTLDFLGSEIPVFRNELQFLMLLINHGGKENWSHLRYLVDLKAYMDRYGETTNWDEVYELATRRGIKKLVDDSLGLLRGAGYRWSPLFPDVKLLDPSDWIEEWYHLPPQPANTSWILFKRSMASHDLTSKPAVLLEHLRFLTDFRLHRQKLKWYRSQAEG